MHKNYEMLIGLIFNRSKPALVSKNTNNNEVFQTKGRLNYLLEAKKYEDCAKSLDAKTQ